jgi:hypothetical protein
LTSDAMANTSTRRCFLSGRVWIVIALLLLLVALGVIAWTIFAD